MSRFNLFVWDVEVFGFSLGYMVQLDLLARIGMVLQCKNLFVGLEDFYNLIENQCFVGL